ncbi:hypothetical protein PRZ48_009267 [Zasmidium cellare]|uniref:O-methyltransferase C-terminal domain-containing protein n=1 Tax=Zasmidium cellare TaxID=395010 RepID=A0ABR0EB88_ZASCE|nr:hypothetical protein PRZ48_009267 [Zasmidium cellare]
MTVTAAALRALAEHPPTDATARRELYSAAQALMFAVEGPMDTEFRMFFVMQAQAWAAARTTSDLNIFETLAANPDKAWKVDDLGEVSGAEPALLPASPSFKLGLKAHEGGKTLLSLPGFLAESGYRTPVDPSKSLFAKVHGMSIFEKLEQDPQRAALMFEFMAEHRKKLPTWMNGSISTKDFQLSDDDQTAGRVMMVDVGGGAGHQCHAFRVAFPQLKGKMVVQDLAVMVDMIDKRQASAIELEPMAHDFFTTQPIKHAKVYHLRNVLHDWADESAFKILEQLRPAMAPDSAVVIDEIVIPPTGANHKLLDYDLTMMSSASALERTEKQWRALIERSGMKLRDIWIYDVDMQWALIVAVPN